MIPSTNTSYPASHSLGMRIAAWLIAGTLACLLGTFAWLVSLALLVAGWLANLQFGLGLPPWTCWLAFVVGMPLGAWLEIRHA